MSNQRLAALITFGLVAGIGTFAVLVAVFGQVILVGLFAVFVAGCGLVIVGMVYWNILDALNARDRRKETEGDTYV